MRIGFGKQDITPRVGVELCGFGPFCCRHSTGVRDQLWARAMAVEADGRRVLVISCDLIGVTQAITHLVRARIKEATGLPESDMMVACTHTHSGPNTGPYIGWGAPDEPYRETVGLRIAQAGIAAVNNLQEAELAHAEVPCEGIGLNREYDQDAPPLAEVLQDSWRPAKPELTDTTCHVLAARDKTGRLLGFASYFGCHPVVCCAENRLIHGDFCGVATNLTEREHPGAIGLFLQGAQGDVNSCVVHKPEAESMLALDVVAGRYARAVRRGLAEARPITVDRVAAVSHAAVFSRKPWGLDKLKTLCAEQEARLLQPDNNDRALTTKWDAGVELVALIALRGLIARAERGESLQPATEVHGVRLGPVTLLGSPFETFQATRNEVRTQARATIPLVMSFVSDSIGYAPDPTVAARGGYAADLVPLICGELPFTNAHAELVHHLLALDAALNRQPAPHPDRDRAGQKSIST